MPEPRLSNRGRLVGESNSALPCTYELDELGEGNGSAHPYCSPECQRDGLRWVSEPRSIEPDGAAEIGDEETICEGCGNYLHKPGQPA